MPKLIFLFSLAVSFCYGQVTLTPYSPVRFPDLVVSQIASGHADSLSVLSNDSDVPIMAVKMFWVDLTGKQVFIHDESAFRQNAARGVRPIVAPHSAALLKPEDENMKYLVPGSKVQLDTVIFADGLIFGPDTTHYADDQVAEYAAAKTIAGRVKAGENPDDIKASIVSVLRLRSATTPGYVGRNWALFYASQFAAKIPAGSQVSRQQATDALVARLSNLPPMPTFHR